MEQKRSSVIFTKRVYCLSIISELLDGLRALGSIASLTSPAAFDSFLKPLGQRYLTYFSSFRLISDKNKLEGFLVHEGFICFRQYLTAFIFTY